MMSILDHSSNRILPLEMQRIHAAQEIRRRLDDGYIVGYEEVEELGDDLAEQLGEIVDAGGDGWRRATPLQD